MKIKKNYKIYKKKTKKIKNNNKKKKNFFFKKKKNIKNKKKIINTKKNKIKKKINYKKKQKKTINKKTQNQIIIEQIKKIIKKGKIKKKRPPIISIMGHVNHGKTSLIKCITNKKIKKEHGNITQYINGYNIETKIGQITLLDTPGHSTFEDMRKNVTKLSDIIIIIISIDDCIMPQTVESIKLAQKYKKKIIISINKIDKENYINNIEKIKKQIIKYQIISEEMGGKNKFINISTKKKIGINKLLDNILTTSNNINLYTYIDGTCHGIIIESSIHKHEGIIANIIIKKGTLKINDIISCNETWGKIKSITYENKKIKKAHPSMVVKINGLSSIPEIGKKFISINNLKKAKKISKIYSNIKKEKKNLKTENKIINYNNIDNKINIIIKSDVSGSLITIKKIIKKNFSENLNIIYGKTGNINKTDIEFSKTTKSIILAFNISIDKSIKNKIEKTKIYNFRIIYKLINKIKKIIKNKNNKNNKKEKEISKSKIKNIFQTNNKETVAGCRLKEGQINIKHYINIIRNNIIIHKNGLIKSLKTFQKNVKIIKDKKEFGIIIKNFNNLKIGDTILTYKIKNEKK